MRKHKGDAAKGEVNALECSSEEEVERLGQRGQKCGEGKGGGMESKGRFRVNMSSWHLLSVWCLVACMGTILKQVAVYAAGYQSVQQDKGNQ